MCVVSEKKKESLRFVLGWWEGRGSAGGAQWHGSASKVILSLCAQY